MLHQSVPGSVKVNVYTYVKVGSELSWRWGYIFVRDRYVPIWPLLGNSHSVRNVTLHTCKPGQERVAPQSNRGRAQIPYVCQWWR